MKPFTETGKKNSMYYHRNSKQYYQINMLHGQTEGPCTEFIKSNLFLKGCLVFLTLSVVGILLIQLTTPLFLENPQNYFISDNCTLGEFKFHFSKARFDKTRQYKSYEWVHMSNKWEKLTSSFHVCLATQSSVDRIWPIIEVSERWLGPISLAVYITSQEEWTVLNLFIASMEQCSVTFRDTVSIHIATPASLVLTEQKAFMSNPNTQCEHPQDVMNNLLETYFPDGLKRDGLYPQNHMRNIARKTCVTDWVFLTDVDIIPKTHSARLLHQFYNSEQAENCKKCAFVIPTIELDPAVEFPETKADVIKYVKKGLGRQFHVAVYDKGHNATNYLRWYATHREEGPVVVSHFVNRSEMTSYEPFYISPDDIPPHDERFLGYGMTRNSQILESKIAGWKFAVLSSVYTIHWGLQTNSTIFKKKDTLTSGQNARLAQIEHNRAMKKDFVAEMEARYKITRKPTVLKIPPKKIYTKKPVKKSLVKRSIKKSKKKT